jgi:ankyrin repeat protein
MRKPGLTCKTSLPTILLFCLSVLIMSKTIANETPDSMQKRLLTAAAQNQAKIVQQLLTAGVDIEIRDTQGSTALLLATHHNAVEAARILIEAGADVNAMDNISDSPYLYAGAEGHLEILRMTLDHGADLTSVNRYGGTALIPAAHHGHIETVRELLQTATDIDHVNNLGWTALLEAVILGDGGPVYIEIVRLLLKAGANVEIADHDGVTPLEHAKQRGYTEISELLSKP